MEGLRKLREKREGQGRENVKYFLDEIAPALFFGQVAWMKLWPLKPFCKILF